MKIFPLPSLEAEVVLSAFFLLVLVFALVMVTIAIVRAGVRAHTDSSRKGKAQIAPASGNPGRASSSGRQLIIIFITYTCFAFTVRHLAPKVLHLIFSDLLCDVAVCGGVVLSFLSVSVLDIATPLKR